MRIAQKIATPMATGKKISSRSEQKGLSTLESGSGALQHDRPGAGAERPKRGAETHQRHLPTGA